MAETRYTIAYYEFFKKKCKKLKIADKYTDEQLKIFTFFYENHTNGGQFRDMTRFYGMYEEFHEVNSIKLDRLSFPDFVRLSSEDLDGGVCEEDSFVYFIADIKNDKVKIGKSNNIKHRLATLRTSNYNDLVMIKSILCKDEKAALSLEKRLHTKYERYKVRGEWFKLKEIAETEKIELTNFYLDTAMRLDTGNATTAIEGSDLVPGMTDNAYYQQFVFGNVKSKIFLPITILGSDINAERLEDIEHALSNLQKTTKIEIEILLYWDQARPMLKAEWYKLTGHKDYRKRDFFLEQDILEDTGLLHLKRNKEGWFTLTDEALKHFELQE